jgi:protein-S-isoprenylcysteine O-methyltransferase Ste14
VIDAVFGVLWVTFWIYWLVAAAATKGSLPGPRRAGSMGVRIRVGILVLVLLLVRSPILRGHSLAVHSAPLQAVGLALFLVGLASAVWARVHLGRNWGVPMSQRVDPELVTTGPYRYVRHPIYSGVLLALVGTALALALYWFVVVVAAGIYFVYSATVEERLMSERFPAQYPAYRARTRMLVPFVW